MLATVVRSAAFVVLAASVLACSSSVGSPSAPGSLAAASLSVATPAASPSPAPATPSPAAPSATPIPGCLPACVTGMLTRPGPLSGDYTTRNFFGGQLTVTVPDGWEGFEDSTGEFAVGPAGSDSRVEFWIDVHVARNVTGAPDPSVGMSAEDVTAWITTNPDLTIISQKPAMFGSLPATAFDWSRSPKAKNTDPGCPTELRPCVIEFGYPEWDGTYTEGGPFRDRLILATATWGGTSHAVYAIVSGVDADAFASFEADATRMIEGARLPAGVEP